MEPNEREDAAAPQPVEEASATARPAVPTQADGGTALSADAAASFAPFVHADAHFRTGTGHDAEGTPCQDYAMSGLSPLGVPFAVVSDGCSTSGRTDVGARVVGLAAAKLLDTAADYHALNSALIQILLYGAIVEVSRILGLRDKDFDATLSLVIGLPDGGARAFVFGDGVVAARTPSGLDVRVVDWAGNMPGYPNYMNGQFSGEPWRRDAFIEQSEAFAKEGGRAACRIRRYLTEPDARPGPVEETGLSAREGLKGVVFEWTPEDRADVVAVMSDGALQVSDVGWSEVIQELAAFKTSREGEFVRRRMTRALSGLAKRGARPVDDISVAAIAKRGAP